MRLRRLVHRQGLQHAPERAGLHLLVPLAVLTAGLGLTALVGVLRNVGRRPTATATRRAGELFHGEARHRVPASAQAASDDAATTLPTSDSLADTSARHRAEMDLREAQRFLSSVIASAPVMINVCDREGRITMSDGARLDTFGLKPGELVGQNCFERYRGRPEQVERIRAALAGVASTGESKRGDRTLEVSHAPRRDSNGAIQGAITIITDISERKLAEAALHESEAFANAVFDNSPVAIHVFDAEGRSVRMNEAQKELMGLPTTSFGIGEFNILTSGFFNAAGISAHFRRAYAGEVVEVQDAQMEDAAGELGSLGETRFAYDLTLFPLHDAAGQVRAVVSFTRDITERKDADRARIVAEQRLRILLSNMPLVMFAIDAEGTITFADGKFLKLPGRHPRDVIGTSIFDFHEGHTEVLANVRRGLDGEEFAISAPFGDQFFESRYSPVRDAEGKVAGLTWVSVDITDRVKAEQQLRESEERYRKTFEGLHDVFYQTNLRDEFTMVSPSVEACFGWTPEESIGTPSRALYLNPADHDVLVTKITTGRPVNDFEAMMRRKDGSTFPVSVNARLVFNEAGTPIAVQGTTRDITARKRFEDALRESEERYRSTFEGMHDVFYQTDRAGLITLVSPSCLRHTGYTVEELLGTPVSTVLVHVEDSSVLVARLIEHGAVNDYEILMRTKAGVEVSVSVNGTTLRAHDGRILGFQGTLRDITARRRAEDERDRIFTLSVDMLSVVRSGGVITRVNPAWTTTLGYAESELVGKNVFDFAHPDDRRQVMREASQVDRGIPLTDLRARFRHGDGTWRWLSWSIAAVSADATTYCVARDVTELMQAQQAALDARVELEETLEAMHASQLALQEQAEEMDRLRIAAEHLAGHDMLTGVINRRAWFAQALEARPSAIAIFDIDYFKKVNDTYGHPAGDEVLREVALRLQSALPEGTLLGRLGGEEFGALFTCDFAEARAGAALAVAAVGATPVTLAGALSLTVTASGGVAPWRRGANSREESLAITYEEADAALYEAKESGRHRLVVRGLKAA